MSPEKDHEIAATVAREGQGLRRYIRRRVDDPAEVEDILQEVFAELVEANRLLMPIEHVAAWLYRVARNRIVDAFRRRKPVLFSDLAASGDGEESLDLRFEDLLPSPEEGPDAAYARALLAEELEEAVADLPADQRFVFVSHEIEGRSFKEMSEELGVPINTLLSRKRYAVLRLRERLRPAFETIQRNERN